MLSLIHKKMALRCCDDSVWILKGGTWRRHYWWRHYHREVDKSVWQWLTHCVAVSSDSINRAALANPSLSMTPLQTLIHKHTHSLTQSIVSGWWKSVFERQALSKPAEDGDNIPSFPHRTLRHITTDSRMVWLITMLERRKEMKWKEVEWWWRGGGEIRRSVPLNGKHISGHFITTGTIVKWVEVGGQNYQVMFGGLALVTAASISFSHARAAHLVCTSAESVHDAPRVCRPHRQRSCWSAAPASPGSLYRVSLW